MKKFLALLLSLAVAMGASPAILAAEEQVQPLPTWAYGVLADGYAMGLFGDELYTDHGKTITDEQLNKMTQVVADKLALLGVEQREADDAGLVLDTTRGGVLNALYQEAAAYYAAAVFSYMKRHNYQQALLLLEKIAGLPNKEGLPHIVSMHLIVLKGICLESLGRYEDACCAFRDAVKAYKNTPCFDAQELQYHLAYCTYYTSQVDLALKLAESLKMSLSQNSRADSLYYRVISLLATIYREKADQRFSEMYLLAINECKEHGFEYEYYVQLRKADLCYTEELSIPMLNEAVKYFKAHNYQKEYGKAVHNLGTDHLYLGNSAEAQETLEASKNIFAKIGSVDEVYGINCMGVWYAVIKQDYHQALRLFHEAERMPINDFKKMTIYANIAACYQKLSSPQECEEYIRKCNELPARKRNKDVGFYVRTILLAQAFCDLEQGQSEQSLKTLRSCWGTTLKNDQSYLVARIGLDICMSLNLPPIEEELKFSRISHSRLYETYYQNRCVFHTLRFIE